MMKPTAVACGVGVALALLGSLDPVTRALARDTLQVVAPMVERAGLPLRGPLEEASFRILDPNAHAALTVAHRADDLDAVRRLVEQRLEEVGIDGVVTARLKSAWSTHRKMARKGVGLDQITDRLAVRARVATVDDCYRLLERMQRDLPILEGSFDDYIRDPKPNGYQSLHAALEVPGVGPVELQVRTDAMHVAAERGDAAHWRYKLAA